MKFYSCSLMAMRQGANGTIAEHISGTVVAHSYHEAVGFATEHCLERFKGSQYYSHSVSVAEIVPHHMRLMQEKETTA